MLKLRLLFKNANISSHDHFIALDFIGDRCD